MDEAATTVGVHGTGVPNPRNSIGSWVGEKPAFVMFLVS